MLQPEGTTNNCFIAAVSANPEADGYIGFFRGLTQLTNQELFVGASEYYLGGAIFLDVVGAGTYTYTLQTKAASGAGTTMLINHMVLVAYEIK